MTENEKDQLVEDWIKLQLSERSSNEYELHFWAFDRLWEITIDQPDLAWELILRILSQNQSDRIMENLSAGPLEDLLAKHGAGIIERVEIEAKQNPQFAFLLGGVWRNSMADDVWHRVQQVWNRRGWDGN